MRSIRRFASALSVRPSQLHERGRLKGARLPSNALTSDFDCLAVLSGIYKESGDVDKAMATYKEGLGQTLAGPTNDKRLTLFAESQAFQNHFRPIDGGIDTAKESRKSNAQKTNA